MSCNLVAYAKTFGTCFSGPAAVLFWIDVACAYREMDRPFTVGWLSWRRQRGQALSTVSHLYALDRFRILFSVRK